MNLLKKCFFAVALGGACPPGQADPQEAMLRLVLDVGKRPVARLTLGFRPRPPTAARERYSSFSLPLLTYHRNAIHAPLLRAAEDSQTFCEKSQAGCIAFASLIGVGIFFVVTQYEHDPESTQTVVVINSGDTESRPRSGISPARGAGKGADPR